MASESSTSSSAAGSLAPHVPMPDHRLHPSFHHRLLKAWNTEATVAAEHLLYPVFVLDTAGEKVEIASMPGQYRWSVDRLPELLDPLVELGLKSVLLFGVLSDATKKTPDGSYAADPGSPAARALGLLKERYPSLLLCVDVCLCAYTTHGHCGCLTEEGHIDNDPSLIQLTNMSVTLAKAGAHVIAPSDMMDGRIAAIKRGLLHHKLRAAVMSYSAKFASCFYGPFRDAAGSGCKFGDRSGYQLPPGSRGLAVRAIHRDIDEGADFVMVKPGGPYLDIVRDCAEYAQRKGVPVAVYQVSGEFAMLYHGAKAGAFGLEEAVMESLLAMRRAGATILITYFVKEVLTVLQGKQQQSR